MTAKKSYSASDINTRLVAHTRPPAKLNLFLELLGRRADGFHEIDTVMVPIDWCDQLRLRRRIEPGIELSVQWLPSAAAIAAELGLDPGSHAADLLLNIPNDQANLVHRALERFSEVFAIQGGFECDLGKSIPTGAGMGGASSDAASALRCAASLCDLDPRDDRLVAIAAEIGSDVPFFLGGGALGTGSNRIEPIWAARATGRGEIITPITISQPIDFVVVFPAATISTALVYANCQVPRRPRTADPLIAALRSHDRQSLKSSLLNRLAVPAKKIVPQIDEILESMWRAGLRTCQLTGSGSACFAITDSAQESTALASKFQAEIKERPYVGESIQHLGVRLRATHSVPVPAEVQLSPTI